MNAMGRFLGGLAHDDSHLEQIGKIMVQARQRRAEARKHGSGDGPLPVER
jgi:hypothetical protein